MKAGDIEVFLAHLLSCERFDEDRQCSTWTIAPGSSCTRCTDSARIVAQRFGGEVFGYPISGEDQPALLGYWSQGHDFALIGGRFLVDYWAAFVAEEGAGVLDLARLEGRRALRRQYKPRREWVRLH